MNLATLINAIRTTISGPVMREKIAQAFEAVQTAVSGLETSVSDVYTKSEVDTDLALKADSADVYTQAEVDTALALKANSADVYTKAETDSAIAGVTVTTDTTLTVSGAAADSKTVGDALADVNISLENIGLSARVKQAFANCFANTAWKDDVNGEECYTELVNALDGNDSDGTYYSVVQDLSGCTSNYSNLTIASGGSLSVTLTPNSNRALDTVTVTMGGTDVTSTAYRNGVVTIASVTGNVRIYATTTYVPSYVTDGLVRRWVASDYDGNGTWTDRIASAAMTVSGATLTGSYLAFDGTDDYGYADMPSGVDAQTLEVVYMTTNAQNYAVAKTTGVQAAVPTTGFTPTAIPYGDSFITARRYVYPSTNVIVCATSTFSGGTPATESYNVYYNGAVRTVDATGSNYAYQSYNVSGKIEVGNFLTAECVPSTGTVIPLSGRIYEIRLYNRVLTADEIAANYEIDSARYAA